MIKISTQNTADKKKAIIQSLPKPQTAEDQYMYSFACTLAGLSYDTPFQSPFYRKDKYWKAILDIEGLRILDKITGDMIDSGTIKGENISDGAISKEKLDKNLNDAVYGEGRIDTLAIQDKAVTSNKLSNDVGQRLLSEGNVKLSNLSQSVKNKLIGDKNVTTDNIADMAISKEKLDEDLNNAVYGDGRINTSAIQNKAVTSDKLSDDTKQRLLSSGNVKLENLSQEVTSKLLADKNVTLSNLATDVSSRLLADGYTGVAKQQKISLLENGATDAEIIAKVNEIIQVLGNAKVTE